MDHDQTAHKQMTKQMVIVVIKGINNFLYLSLYYYTNQVFPSK